MQSTPKITQLFQTTAFKVTNIEEFSNLPTVKHIQRIMVGSGLSVELYHDHFSFGLNTMSASDFPFDNKDIYTANDLLKLLLDIQDYIDIDSSCHVNYVEHEPNAELKYYSMIINNGETDGTFYDCNSKNVCGYQTSNPIDGLAP